MLGSEVSARTPELEIDHVWQRDGLKFLAKEKRWLSAASKYECK